MAHVLRITDGTNTVTFTSGSMYLSEYNPQVAIGDDPLREKVVIGFTGTMGTIRGNIQAINRLLARANTHWYDRSVPEVYAEFDPGSSGSAYRSQLFGGLLRYDPDLLGSQWAAQNVEAMLEWERQPYWEGPLTVLPLTNSSTSNSTSGIVVNNVDDPAGENWVSIAAADVVGDIPAPIKVTMVNAYASSAACKQIYMFHNIYSQPATLTHVLEGETGTSGASGVLTSAGEGSTGASLNSYASISWNSTNEVPIAYWNLSSAMLGSAGGGRFGIFARWYGPFPYTNCYLRLRLGAAGYLFWEGDLKLAGTDEIHWLDTRPIPPYLSGNADIRNIDLYLYAARNTAGTHTISLDYLMFGPVSPRDGWRRFLSDLGGVAYNESFVDDETEDETYSLDSSGDKIAEFTSYGGPILLEPNKFQKLYFLTADANGLALVEQSWTVTISYRPRRYAL